MKKIGYILTFTFGWALIAVVSAMEQGAMSLGMGLVTALIILAVIFFGGKLIERSEREMYMRICPECGAYLDPGERCDCHIERREKENAPPKGSARKCRRTVNKSALKTVYHKKVNL